jgi:GR25 family glycosyltransferase involved in LPS biosynthesis
MDYSSISSIPFYVISFNNEERKNRMMKRFNQLEFSDINFIKEVYKNDERITSLSNMENYEKIDPRTWSIMLQHMDSVKDFYYNKQSDLCILCEDDIMISKYLKEDLKDIITNFYKLNLDVIMLGYLLPFKIDSYNTYFKELHQTSESSESSESSQSSQYKYYTYPNDIWGTQMYMISKKYAKYLLDTFHINYAYDNIEINPYSSDWIITKNGNRALLYPMVAVEEGINLSDDECQISYHKLCYAINFVEDKFI